ncbi:NAC domain-containing protein 2-like [Hibiscus syriacus]|uniref:NAC domain-containing protein 2-like n=1 Tax=Hibiscus syriacus TaxID=106335 RepID=A0A6A2XNW7_HIBSY|nr:NAC domain-containing protein 2-like [Hibiscus syriacus]
MDREGGSHGGSCYYSVLGIRKGASFSDVCTSYRKLAMKWHPDRYSTNPGSPAKPTPSKRSMYDAGLYDPFEEDQEFCDFMQEMISMMNNVKDEGDSFEDLQRMFAEMVGGDDIKNDPTARKKARGTASKGNAAKRNSSRC